MAHQARVYDYWLGGKDNYTADREAAEQAIRDFPAIVAGVKEQRAFDAAHASSTIRQFAYVTRIDNSKKRGRRK